VTSNTRDEYKFTRCDRAELKRPKDNLRLEGKFEGTSQTKDDFKPTRGDRVLIKNSRDNFRYQRQFEGTPICRNGLQHTRYFHEDIRKPNNNLRPEGELESPDPQQHCPVDRADIIRHTDTLRFESDFYRP
jgi:hypothetical protein